MALLMSILKLQFRKQAVLTRANKSVKAALRKSDGYQGGDAGFNEELASSGTSKYEGNRWLLLSMAHASFYYSKS